MSGGTSTLETMSLANTRPVLSSRGTDSISSIDANVLINVSNASFIGVSDDIELTIDCIYASSDSRELICNLDKVVPP